MTITRFKSRDESAMEEVEAAEREFIEAVEALETATRDMNEANDRLNAALAYFGEDGE